MEELLVIGAGPCGLAVGVAARQAGMDCLLIDKGPVVHSIERFPLAMKFNSTAELLEIGQDPFVIAADKPTRGEALGLFVAGVLVAGNAPGRVFIENGRLHGPAIVRSLETRAR